MAVSYTHLNDLHTDRENDIEEELKFNVLLVDDSEINLAVEKEILESFGLTVYTADSGKSAVRFVEKQGVDLILLDLRMPEDVYKRQLMNHN